MNKSLPTLKKADSALIIADDPLAEIDLRHFCNIKCYKIKNISDNKSDKKKYYEIMCFEL